MAVNPNRRNSGKGIVQWNCQGIGNKKEELLELIEKMKPEIIALQETMIGNGKEFRIPNYTILRREGHYSRRWHGGVALLIHDTIPMQEVELNTNIQAVAARVDIGHAVTVCSLYSAGAHQLTRQMLNNLFDQLADPVIIMGDFNAHNTAWNCQNTNERGRMLERVIAERNLNILNDGTPTRVSGEEESVIDISGCSPRLQMIID